MISLNKLKKSRGSTTKSFQKGRGIGSGNGKTCGKGHKGQKSRSGHMKVGFEGGQNPLFRRIPKFGLKSVVKRKKYVAINVDFLNIFDDGAVIDISLLKNKRIIKKKDKNIKIKILGNGELTKKLNVKAHKFSLLAKKKIEEAGGSIEIINN